MRALPLVVALVPALASCVTETTSRPAPAPPVEVVRTTPARAWRVVADGSPAGWVVEYESPGGRRWFSVRNGLQQELGGVDALGRAWRYVPHQREPEYRGAGSVADGAGRVLGLSGAVEIEPVDLADLGTVQD